MLVGNWIEITLEHIKRLAEYDADEGVICHWGERFDVRTEITKQETL